MKDLILITSTFCRMNFSMQDYLAAIIHITTPSSFWYIIFYIFMCIVMCSLIDHLQKNMAAKYPGGPPPPYQGAPPPYHYPMAGVSTVHVPITHKLHTMVLWEIYSCRTQFKINDLIFWKKVTLSMHGNGKEIGNKHVILMITVVFLEYL